jgi:hypothetical protein
MRAARICPFLVSAQQVPIRSTDLNGGEAVGVLSARWPGTAPATRECYRSFTQCRNRRGEKHPSASRWQSEYGRFIFVEHGYSQDASVVVRQNRLNPVWKRIGGGCNLNRKIVELINGAGFRIIELKTEYLSGRTVPDVSHYR